MGRLKNSSKSTLGRPDRPIYVLAGQIQDYIYLPNPDPLYVVLGTLAANMLEGVPVWLVLVGPPASGKTLMLDILHVDEKYRMPKYHGADLIKGMSALLSGVSKKDVTKGATGGLLQQIGSRGVLLVKDFTSMMSMAREPLLETIGALRRVYDGSCERPIGSDGGRVLTWRGKIAFLSACTGVIDRHHQILNELGQRWVYYRLDETDGFGEGKKAATLTKEDFIEMHKLVRAFLDHVGVSYLEPKLDKRELEDAENARLFSMAAFIAAGRSPVTRDWHSKEIVEVPETEKPTRLQAALSQLYLGLEVIGLEESERWRVVGRVAMDSLPRIRNIIINSARESVKAVGVAGLRDGIGCGSNTIRWTFEELERHGVFEQVERGDRFGDKAGTWRLTQWSRKHIKLGWG